PVVPEILRAKIAVFVDLYKKTEQVKRQAEERTNLIREQAARAESERRQGHLAFLAEASKVLAGSLDLQETFRNVAKLVVRKLADFCLIFTRDAEGTLQQVALAHDDFTGRPELLRLIEEFPQNPAAQHAAEHVLQIGKAASCCDPNNGALHDLFAHEEDR